MNQKKKPKLSKLAILADKAFKEAVAEVIEKHRRSGEPIAIWRDGEVVIETVDKLEAETPRIPNPV